MGNFVRVVFDCGKGGRVIWEAPKDMVPAGESSRDASRRLNKLWQKIFLQLCSVIRMIERLPKGMIESRRKGLSSRIESAVREVANDLGLH